jgi:hypothetical protein
LRTAVFEQVVMVRSGGHWILGGEPPSFTVTMKRHMSLFSQRSTATQVTTCSPHGRKVPEGGVQVTATEPLLSLTVGAGYVTMAPQPPAAVLQARTVLFVGHSILGGSVSRRTVTVNEQESVLRQSSITRQVTVCSPNPKVEPDGGVQVTCFPAQPPMTTGGGYCQTMLEEHVHNT